MDGNPDAEVDNLCQKAKEFAKNIYGDEAWHAFNSTIMKALEYPMPATNLSKVKWDYVMKPILKIILPKSGIVHTFPHSILYAPESSSGLVVMHPFYKQQLKHLTLILCVTFKPSIRASLLVATIEQL